MSPVSTSMEKEESSVLNELLQWAAKLGVSDSSSSLTNKNPSLSSSSCLSKTLKVFNFPLNGGRGLSALHDLNRGDLLLKVPKVALFTAQRLMEDDQHLSFALANYPALSSSQRLSVCLLYEVGKAKSSWWYVYLMNLPRSYNVLAGFGEFERRALQVDDAVWAAEKAVDKAQMDWNDAKKVMEELRFKPQLMSFKAWIWASATVSSRTMHISWDDAGCLCPVGDLFNYAAPGEESDCVEDVEDRSNAELQRLTDGCFEEDVDSYCFYARENYKEGEQVLLSYGTYTNLELLEHYGFILDENPNDKVFISLEPSMYSINSWPQESLFIQQNGKPSFTLLSTLRLWATPQNQRKSVSYLAYSGYQLSEENEISIMKWISNKCQTMLKKLPTSINEDTSLLTIMNKIETCDVHELEKVLTPMESEGLTFLEAGGCKVLAYGKIKVSIERWRLAVQWRLRYKRTLADCISYCDGIISSLLSRESHVLEVIDN